MTKPLITLEYVKSRLHHWAGWYDKDQDHPIGYARCSLEYRMMQEGVVIKTQGVKPLPCDQKAEEIEAYVCELAIDAPHIAFALRSHYFSSMYISLNKHDLQLTEDKKKQYVDRGHQWLLWKISIFYEE